MTNNFGYYMKIFDLRISVGPDKVVHISTGYSSKRQYTI